MEFQKINGVTPNGSSFNLEALYRLLPACFTEKDVKGPDGVHHTERVIDFDKLKSFLGEEYVAEEGDEVYDFTWVGKRAARADAAAPINKTLRPSPEESVNWDTTKNLYIEGDNLEALKLLQTSYMGKVKMIYIDPPYNTGKDFVYEDSYSIDESEFDIESGNVDENGDRYRGKYSDKDSDKDSDRYRYKINLSSAGRYHSKWCSMIYSRLLVARSLLAEDGVIFVSIDDNEAKNLKNIMDEVFGEYNFLAQIVWERAFSPINLMKHFSPSHDYVLAYARNPEAAICNGIPRSDEANDRYSNPDNDPRGVWMSSDMSVGPAVQENIYPITTPSGRIVEPPAGRSWSLSRNAFRERLQDNRIWFGPDGSGVPRIKRFLSELRKTGITPMTIWKHEEVGHSQDATQKLARLFGGKKYFDYPKPVGLIKRIVGLYSDPDCTILDFFSGSATTAQAVFELNKDDGGHRKWILVQYPEDVDKESDAYKDGFVNICEIGKERIRRAGAQIQSEIAASSVDGDIFNQDAEKPDIDTGFRVFKVADSYFEDVKKSPSEYSQDNLDLFLDNIKPDTPDLDLLFGCMLQWGVELSLPLTSKEVGGCTIYNVNDGDLVACFAENVGNDVVDTIADHHPLRVVFRDGCFQDDAQKMNLIEQFKQRCGWSEEDAIKRIRVI